MAHLKRVINFALFFMTVSNSATINFSNSSYPDKSGQRRTNTDTPFYLSKYSIFSRYLWVGLFP